jgi:hypothetical protein
LGETHPVGGYGVDVRRGDLRVSLATQFPIAQVVGKEQHDVGRTLRGLDLERKGKNDCEHRRMEDVLHAFIH